ncbi:MAG: biotin--[acetyl-CoA-carboxylase] ligase [Candidatus Izemoplasmatales bacterium]|jgi:BirA family biotin operon repressor/biotin-[acetyl-CoA-carboxylase] ligase|nr:biotin--[acetyl-CoA-carboxylase] ligase [Candidatus Izemoplasmatales bacterium]
MVIGTNIIGFDSIDSTNDYLKRQTDVLEDGCICYALTQERGRGRRENNWISPRGNLYFSILKKNRLERNMIFSETIMISVAIAKIFEKYELEPIIKYPNDILVNGKKIAGILIETTGTEQIDSVIIGVGININQEDFKSLNKKATSLKLQRKGDYSLEDILSELISIYNKLGDIDETYKIYLQKSLIINKEIILDNKKYRISNIFLNGDILIKNECEEVIINSNILDFSNLYND